MDRESIETVEHSGGHGNTGTNTLVCEAAWEVCQQVGGIYTVLRSKAPSVVKRHGQHYCLIGPYNPDTTPQEFEETPLRGIFGEAVKVLRAAGLGVHYGYWLITGRPRVVLFETASVFNRLAEIKYALWEHHGISMGEDALLNQVAAFGYMIEQFFRALLSVSKNRPIIAHCHEWMAATAIPEMRHAKLPVAIVFTTHATLLGRYVASADPWFYDHVPFVKWEEDARRFNIETQVKIERAAAHGAHIFTTVSRITSFECEHLLGRKPELLLPNGFNIERFVAMHEFQNLHRLYKEQINRFVTGHFFPSYTFDLDKTLYFFTSGRYEYLNKGFNLTIDALARLNWQMKEAKLDKTVVFFLVTKQPFKSINADVLRNRAMMQEIQKTCEHIKDQVGERLFTATAMGKTMSLDALLDDYWRLRLRRLMHEWRAKRPPTIVTHDMIDDAHDEVLRQLRERQLFNLPSDPVKVVYHPDFITPTSPLFGMDYDQFVRGCHLGIFPSAYEPWGYTPMECMARGVPAVTSDLSGFGTYLMDNMPDYEERGLFVVKRRSCSYDAAADQLTQWLFKFLVLDRRERIAMRNKVESSCDEFDWSSLEEYYELAHEMALERAKIQ
ncbi:MAG: glycosyltransferase [Sedimentisphaerales bacterium]|nr:glycosyltransferase [Sedimentisphaerales bacterium]